MMNYNPKNCKLLTCMRVLTPKSKRVENRVETTKFTLYVNNKSPA